MVGFDCQIKKLLVADWMVLGRSARTLATYDTPFNAKQLFFLSEPVLFAHCSLAFLILRIVFWRSLREWVYFLIHDVEWIFYFFQIEFKLLSPERWSMIAHAFWEHGHAHDSLQMESVVVDGLCYGFRAHGSEPDSFALKEDIGAITGWTSLSFYGSSLLDFLGI